MENITSNKRKSFGAKGKMQNSPSGSAKSPKQTPAKNVQKPAEENSTPNLKKSPFVAQSETKPNQRAQGNKRKSLPATLQESGGEILSKKQKLAGSGTDVLTPKQKLPKTVEKKEESAENGVKKSRSQRRRELVKHKRQGIKVGEYVKKISTGDKDAIEKIKARIEEIRGRDTLTASAKRKLCKLTGALKKCGIDIPGQGSGKKQPNQKKTEQKSVQLEDEDESKEVQEESDDDEEKSDDDEEKSDNDDKDDAPKKVLSKKQQQKPVSSRSPFAKGKKINMAKIRNGKKAVQA